MEKNYFQITSVQLIIPVEYLLITTFPEINVRYENHVDTPLVLELCDISKPTESSNLLFFKSSCSCSSFSVIGRPILYHQSAQLEQHLRSDA